MGTAPVRAYSISSGCSSRHDMHHDAQTLSNQMRPRISCAEKDFDGSFSWASLKDGAGLLISGEGTSWGSRPNPIARNTTSTPNITSGMRYRVITNVSVFLRPFYSQRLSDAET